MAELTYRNITYFTRNGVNFWQGIKHLHGNTYLIVGTEGLHGIMYIGPIDGAATSIYIINYPNSISTSIYGCDYAGNGIYKLVGVYKTGDFHTYGFIFIGRINQLNNPLFFTTINTTKTITYLHSIMNKLLVGNDGDTFGDTKSFLYHIDTQLKQEIEYPGAITTTTYGIWYKGCNNYTICGGYSNVKIPISEIYFNGIPKPFGKAFLADYNNKLKKFSNWRTFKYPGNDVESHFEGISYSLGKYQLAFDSIKNGDLIVSWAETNKKGTKLKKIIDLDYPESSSNTTSSNSVAENIIVGVFRKSEQILSYQAQII